ncbi:MAG: SAM-dependent methyltransferase [Gammaproteobacteria bacterium]|jgi:SAM-dependent MidA family methyltransferase|nr:SAM-dependent methyltransferase [Gammaproteobacteria bacterium]
MSSRNSSLSLPEPPAGLLDISNQLCTRIVKRIDAEGPLPFDRYMAMALYEPGLGYYVNGLHKFGAAGDFVTAPGQGRIFARALAVQLDELAALLAGDWTLLELGPGNGELARDLLLALERPPTRYLMLESSAALRAVQRGTLGALPDEALARIEWIDAPPEEAFDGVVIANEVIDALPTSRFEIRDSGATELAVTTRGPGFGWTRLEPGQRLANALNARLADLDEPLAPGYRSEICVDLPDWLRTVSQPLDRGLVLLIDYGYPRREYYLPDRSSGTLVCHYRHRAHFDPFVWPGLTDLSTFVDFTAVAEAGESCGLELAGFTSQAAFLMALGAHEQIERASDSVQRLEFAAEFKRLTLPGEMGEKFKVMALTRGIEEPLRGFGFVSQAHRL